MVIGYARVSTQEQNLDLQMDALLRAGCDKIFKEHISGKNTQRAELQNMISILRAGDKVVVWKLDRLGRSLRDLIDLVTEFQKLEVNFISLHDNIDTTTATGRFTFNLFASIAEFERDIIRQRTKAGLAAARERGKIGGRPKGLSKEKIAKAKTASLLFKSGEKTVEEILRELKIGRATFYRYIKKISENSSIN